MSEQPVTATVAPPSKPEPVRVTESLEVVVVPGTAEGLISWIPLVTAKPAAKVAEPPSGFDTVTS
jgi:hypothetical protein